MVIVPCKILRKYRLSFTVYQLRLAWSQFSHMPIAANALIRSSIFAVDAGF